MMRFFIFLTAVLFAAQAGAQTSTTLDVPIIVTHAASGPAQTLLPMTQQAGTGGVNPLQFLAGTGSANNFVGNPPPAAIYPASPVFAGTYSLGGADASKFTINASTGAVRVGASALAAGTYNITICATQAGVIGSPACSPWVLQGVDINDTSTLFMQLDNYNPAPGGTVNVTVRNAPNTSGGDYVWIQRNYNGLGYSNTGTVGVNQQYVGSVGTHNAVLALTVPNPPTDSYQFLNVLFVPNNGVGSQATARTADLIIQPSIPFVMPTATNTLVPPFTPTQTITVCPAGVTPACQYTELSQAIIGLSNSNTSNTADNVLITMQAAAYEDCIQFGNSSPFTAPTNNRIWHLPPHLWIKGVGGAFAHIATMDNPAFLCNGKGTIVFWGNATDILTIDNLEISDWVNAAPSGAVYVGLGNVTLRNVYIHDGNMGIITSDQSVVSHSITNSRFARGGGPAGPSHNIYIGEAASFSIDHSISQQALTGHEVKCRALTCHVTCNLLHGTEDPYYVNSEEVDFADGVSPPSTVGITAYLNNNTLVKGAGGNQQNQAGFAMDLESYYPGNNYTVSVNNNIFIWDGTAQHWFFYIGPTSGTDIMHPEPQTWTNNIFVGSNGAADPYGVYPYYSYAAPNATTGAGYPNTTQITEVGDVRYPNRAAAGITQTYPPPPGCTGTIGNMAVP